VPLYDFTAVKRLFLVPALAAGCASATPETTTTPVAAAQDARLEELEAARAEQAREMRELRSRLALAESEADELRRRQTTPTRSETMRIGDERPARRVEDDLSFFTEEEDLGAWDEPARELPEDREPEPEASGPRPVLRLYGTPEVPPLEIPEAPGGVTPTLPLAATPTLGAVPSAPPMTYAVAPAPSGDVPPWQVGQPPQTAGAGDTAAYREALGHVRDRHFGQALRALDGYLAAHPSGEHVAGARYWHAEVLYIQRRYSQALRGFERYLQAHARGSKAADAMLKVGLCHQRMGNAAAARQAFDRLRREHPESVAARLASQGGA